MEQKLWYLDTEALGNSLPLFPSEIRVINAGKAIQPSYPDCEVIAIDRILSEQYDFHLNFHKDLPQFSFYPVPNLLIFAIDSHGGNFVSTADSVNISEEAAAIFYLCRDGQLHYLAPNLRALLSLLVFIPDWKESLGLKTLPSPEPSEKGRAYLIETFQLYPVSLPATAPQIELRLFRTLAAAMAVLPFVALPDPCPK